MTVLYCALAFDSTTTAGIPKNSTSRAEDNIAYSISRGGLCRSQSHPSRYHGLLTALPTPFEPFIPPIPSIARAVMFAAKNKGEKAYLLRCCEYCWRVKRNSGLEHGLWCFCAGCMLAKLQQYLYSLIITTLSGCSGGRELLNTVGHALVISGLSRMVEFFVCSVPSTAQLAWIYFQVYICLQISVWLHIYIGSQGSTTVYLVHHQSASSSVLQLTSL
ncbi:hypothetical protein BDZ45DRAFT_741792 [Acephala macrosclerotiorum]|nr:hypothetical protein BDZ45DRAFT_741792 [Acephala macrosclerotiorum]